MKIAQKLYEGVEIGDQGAVGLITYMRTDSVRVSDQALAEVRGYIEQRYGKQYVPEKPNYYRSAKSAQEAHEAIRPTAVGRDPESLSRYLAKDELALYTLIFNRFVSSQMPPAVFDRTTVDIIAGDEQFRATGQVMKFDGFIRVYLEGVDETAEDDDQAQLPQLTEGEILRLLEFYPEQHFTQPPPRFTQATLIKELEENGIGRPSTYASIMTSILNREYVDEDESKRLRPTSLGRIVIDLLVAAFPDIVEVGFTAHMEEQLDRVEEGKEDWVKTLKRFYSPFKKRLGEARKKMPMVKGKGVPDRSDMRAGRRRDGDQVGPQRRVPGLLELSRLREHQGVRARRSGQYHDQGTGARAGHRSGLRQMRQADGAPALALRRIPGLLGVSRMQRDQEAAAASR